MRHLLISGGGISGLSLAALARRSGFQCTVIERGSFANPQKQTIGGGLGLWPATIQIMDRISHLAKEDLVAKGKWMAGDGLGYFDCRGNVLAQPTPLFGSRFPVLCLDRVSLLEILFKYATMPGTNVAPVVTIENATIESFTTSKSSVTATLSTGATVTADLLIDASGIHSKLRPSSITPKDVGYTYFRANVNISPDSPYHATSFETWGHCLKTQLPMRFGFVPLKSPSVFWFLAVPTSGASPFGAQGIGASIISETDKLKLLDLVQGWQGPHDKNTTNIMHDLIQSTPQILRTDIHKIPSIQNFPWYTHEGRVILLGDAAHATAPNLAQGAGLCIEDAAALVSLLERIPKDLEITSEITVSLAKEYERARKLRASTVQFIADSVAVIGQLNPKLSWIRDAVFHKTHLLVPRLQSRIFEWIVAYSLGADSSNWFWRVPSTKQHGYSILESILPQKDLDSLAPYVKEFKTDKTGVTRSGDGIVTVERSSYAVGRLVASVLGLPKQMELEKFKASVSGLDQTKMKQKWTRVFGVGKAGLQKAYSTTHGVLRGGYLAEGVGGIMDPFVQLMYSVETQDSGNKLCFTSQGMRIFGLRLPINLVSSYWTETAIPAPEGWEFDGTISMFGIGKLMRYYGHFKTSHTQASSTPEPAHHAIVTGGTGLIGTAVVHNLLSRGWRVTILTRKSPIEILKSHPNLQHLQWDAKTGTGWSHAIQSNTVLLNLAGSSLADAGRWTDKVKKEILETRVNSVQAVHDAIRVARETRNVVPRGIIQGSAAGIAGDSGDAVVEDSFALHESQSVAKYSAFRPETVHRIEQVAMEKFSGAGIPLSIVRTGHVFAAGGGLLPYLKLAAMAHVSRIGSGSQYVPWIHIEDAANGIRTIMESPQTFEGTVNLVGPTPATNAQVLKSLGSLGLVPVSEELFKAVIGESSCVVLDSEKLVPTRLKKSGFKFEHETVDEAVNSL
ncbi:UNVERIFIED_CONTAM: hypothetical protein HDU68_003712 [Siphonaria sp. JEL0065]|nr:hypothetical protein HDU68_003712 [Siphonaria sp. JEL0065]